MARILTAEQFNQQYGQAAKPQKLDQQQFQQTYGQQVPQEARQAEPKQDKSFLRKAAEFIAPTATGSFEKIKEGEKLTARDIVGSALEIGSFFIPAGGIARGLGLAGKGALTLGRKLALGAATGAATGGTFEAGRTIGQEGTGFGDVAKATAAGVGLGAVGGAAIPIAGRAITGAVRGARAIPGVAQTVRRGTERGARAVGGVVGDGVTTIGRRVPEKVGQFAERRAEKAARLKGKPAHVQEAVRKNIEAPIVDFVRKANPVDKAKRIEMLDIAKKGSTDLSFRGQAKQVPGKIIVDGPVSHLIRTKDVAVNQTKNVLKKLGDKPQQARPIFNEFLKDMAESGVTPVKGKLVATRGSKIPDGDLKFYNQIYSDLRPNRKLQVPLTFKQMHSLRQKYFDVSKADQTFTAGTTSYARRLRAILAKPIDKASKGQYKAAQNRTREALEGLQEFVKLIGYKGNLEDLAAKDLKAGEVFLRVFGNAADRPTSVLNKLYSTAKKHGYKGKENIFDQLRFADILEDIYGSPTRGLRGQVGRGLSDAGDPLSKGLSAAREATKWSPVSAALRLTRGVLAGTGDDTLKAFENLIRAEGGQKIPTVFGSKAKNVGEVVENIKTAAKPVVEEGRSVFGRR